MGRTAVGSMLVLGALGALACAEPDETLQSRDERPREVARFVEIERFTTTAATQGVAVDAEHFYAIGTRSIEKYTRADGVLAAHWEAGEDPRVIHLNGGIVHEGRLVCAHSNYPGVPMRSSILSFDTDTLNLVSEEALPWAPGSLTWLDRHAGQWWLAFAHYAGRGGEPGKGPEATRLVLRGSSGLPARSLRFPGEVLDRFAGYSSSGGVVGPDGELYVTGHDAAEVYILRIPETGDSLEWVSAVPAPIAGQGVAWDAAASELWGIVRGQREVRRLKGP